MPQYSNGKLVLHKYIGKAQTFEDNFGKWQTISYTSHISGFPSSKTTFLLADGLILFHDPLPTTSSTPSGKIVFDNFPAECTNLKVVQGSFSSNASIVSSHLEININQMGWADFPLDMIKISYTQQN